MMNGICIGITALLLTNIWAVSGQRSVNVGALDQKDVLHSLPVGFCLALGETTFMFTLCDCIKLMLCVTLTSWLVAALLLVDMISDFEQHCSLMSAAFRQTITTSLSISPMSSRDVTVRPVLLFCFWRFTHKSKQPVLQL